jgi:hypothetical protein
MIEGVKGESKIFILYAYFLKEDECVLEQTSEILLNAYTLNILLFLINDYPVLKLLNCSILNLSHVILSDVVISFTVQNLPLRILP